MNIRTIAFLYLLYVTVRVGYQLGPLGSGATKTHFRDTKETMERFRQLGAGTKAVVIFVGVPCYAVAVLIPHETANSVHWCGRVFIEHFVPWLIQCIVDLAEWLYRTIWQPLRAWVIVPAYNILLMTHRGLVRILEWTVDKAYVLAHWVTTHVITPVCNTLLMIVEWALDKAYVVYVTSRDLCWAIWQPLRAWLVEKLYNLYLFLCVTCGLIASMVSDLAYSLVDYIYVFGEHVSAICHTAYEVIEITCDFVISFFCQDWE